MAMSPRPRAAPAASPHTVGKMYRQMGNTLYDYPVKAIGALVGTLAAAAIIGYSLWHTGSDIVRGDQPQLMYQNQPARSLDNVVSTPINVEVRVPVQGTIDVPVGNPTLNYK